MTQGQYAEVNGLKLYYELHGTGEPVVLLHGGFGTTGSLGPLLPALAETRQVIAVELEGHGHTALLDRPLSFERMADDIAALVGQLGHTRVDIVGYSLGGDVSLHVAGRHPQLVRKLVLVSVPFRTAAWYPEVHAAMKAMNAATAAALAGSPMHRAYIGAAPRPEDWTELVVRMGQLIGQDYDWTPAVKTIQAPTLIVFADADSIHPAHAVEFYELLGGGKGDAGWDNSRMPASRLAILPGTSHYNSFYSPLLAPIVKDFLDGPQQEPAAVR